MGSRPDFKYDRCQNIVVGTVNILRARRAGILFPTGEKDFLFPQNISLAVGLSQFSL